jgi:hypothetical protein
LQSLQASRFLLKVVHVATGTLVWQREHGRLLSGIFTVDVVAHARRGVAVDVIRVVLHAILDRNSRKVHSEGTLTPATPERMALHGTSQLTRYSSSSCKDTAAFWISKGKSREVVPEALGRWEHLAGGDLVMDVG